MAMVSSADEPISTTYACAHTKMQIGITREFTKCLDDGIRELPYVVVYISSQAHTRAYTFGILEWCGRELHLLVNGNIVSMDWIYVIHCIHTFLLPHRQLCFHHPSSNFSNKISSCSRIVCAERSHLSGPPGGTGTADKSDGRHIPALRAA